MKRVALVLAVSLLAGCASSHRTNDLRLYATLAAADAVTTYVGIERGLEEANPLMTVAGDDAAQVALTSAVISALAGYLFDRYSQRGGRGHDHRAWRTVNLLRAFAVAWNLTQIAEADQP